MPILPLPPGGGSLSGGDVPVLDGADVLAEFPQEHRKPADAPVRDGFCAAFAAGFIEYQERSSFAAEQCDPLRATGDSLLEKAAEHGVHPAQGEATDDFRARIFAAPEIVTPDAIESQINDLIAPYTTSKCAISELELDGLFVQDGTSTWHSFIGADPYYPDRLYPDDASENGGISFACNPGGAIPATGLSHSFYVRVPSVEGATGDFAFLIDSSDEIAPVADGSNTSGSESDGSVATFIFTEGETADELYEDIIGVVERIKGQGMTWTLYVDSRL